jgi:hypothetical protein
LSAVDLLQTVTVVIAALSVVVTGLQVRHEARGAKKARQAELSWSMYVAYTSPEIRMSRSRAEVLANSSECPGDEIEYQDRVADGWPWKEHLGESLDADVRRLLRFYNQLAILLRQNLIDDDFVFRLVGIGLISAWPTLEPAIHYYQRFYGDSTGPLWRDNPRPLYSDIYLLRDRSLMWLREHSNNVY